MTNTGCWGYCCHHFSQKLADTTAAWKNSPLPLQFFMPTSGSVRARWPDCPGLAHMQHPGWQGGLWKYWGFLVSVAGDGLSLPPVITAMRISPNTLDSHWRWLFNIWPWMKGRMVMLLAEAGCWQEKADWKTICYILSYVSVTAI